MAEQRDFDKLWDYNNPAATEKKFRDILPSAEKSKDRGYYIELLTQLARTYSLRKKFDMAHVILDKAMKIIRAEHIIPRIRYMLERGRTYNSNGEINKASELFKAAFLQAEKYGEEYLAIDAAHMMGIVTNGEDSIKWNEIAIKLAMESNDENAKRWLGSLYNNTAWTYFDMMEFDKAIELHKKNVEYHSLQNNKQQLSIAKWSVARVMREMGNAEEALNMQISLQNENKKLLNSEDGYNFKEIGECLIMLGKDKESKLYFKRAYELLRDDIWLEKSEKNRLKKLAE
ncbi:MAG: hypothetical protein IT280_08365 [Ignavibacteria bacterium]|nr:hypothetical protein [Ignavibacteria bacterium]